MSNWLNWQEKGQCEIPSHDTGLMTRGFYTWVGGWVGGWGWGISFCCQAVAKRAIFVVNKCVVKCKII